ISLAQPHHTPLGYRIREAIPAAESAGLAHQESRNSRQSETCWYAEEEVYTVNATEPHHQRSRSYDGEGTSAEDHFDVGGFMGIR
ncbi:hypothetical protein RUND412_007073, partial [Rhizina undulata]